MTVRTHHQAFPVILLAVLLSQDTAGQDARPGEIDLAGREERSYSNAARKGDESGTGQGFDVAYYFLDLRFGSSVGLLQGRAIIDARVINQEGTSITLDLASVMQVDSVFVDGVFSAFTRPGPELSVTLPRPFAAGEVVRVEVHYRGFPGSTGFGSYSDFVRPSDGKRWIYTLSEPYGARDWWPGVDHPSDKADSVDVWLTVPSGYQGISNGQLKDTTQNVDGSCTYKWQHRSPIAPYLISANVGSFETFSHWYRYGSADSMEIVNYVQPNLGVRFPPSLPSVAKTPRMMEVFANAFGQYPFIDEGYGHIEFGWGGAMEHQTLTSMGFSAFNESTIAHELAHQWFGDMITCRTWQDLWLNEGFATWCDAFFQEKEYGYDVYMSALNQRASAARGAIGTLFVQDTSDVRNLFAGGRVYSKGAWVLHMLRSVLGDSVFFASMRAYANDPTLKYRTAATEDFQRNCETVSGRDLAFFFDEWVYGERFPQYQYSLSTRQIDSLWLATVRIRQVIWTSRPGFFVMPVELQFFGDGLDTTVTVWNFSADQTYTISLPILPDSATLDPDDRILKTAIRVPANSLEDLGIPDRVVLSQNYPNPFNAGTVIRFGVPQKSSVRLVIVDVAGRTVEDLDLGDVHAGFSEVEWNPQVASGTYFYRIIARPNDNPFRSTEATGKLVVVR